MKVKKFFKEMKFKPKKYLGQNFLIDEKILEKIIVAADLKKDDVVLEVGAGLGNLTEKLAEKVKLVVAVEKDKKLAEFLREKFRNFKNVKIVEGDILRNFQFSIFPASRDPAKRDNFQSIFNSQTPISKKTFQYKVVANIPYYITSRFLKILLEAENKPKSIVLLIQKEVAERVCAKKGEHSLLSLSVQYYGNPQILGFVSKNAFYPAPKVDSAILKIEVFKKSPYQIEDKKLFFNIIRAVFQSRRKQLHNSLNKNLKIPQKTVENVLLECKIPPQARPQDLGLDDFKNLYSVIHKEIEGK